MLMLPHKADNPDAQTAASSYVARKCSGRNIGCCIQAMPEVARLLGVEVPPEPASAESGERSGSGGGGARPALGATGRREMLPFGEELTEEEQLVCLHS